MSLSKKGLSFFFLSAVVIAVGLMAIPLWTTEAKGRQPYPSDRSTSSASHTPALVASGLLAQNSANQNIDGLKSSLLGSLFLPQLSGSPFLLPSLVNPSVVRVVGATLQAGQNGTVNIELDSQGNENALGFSLNFDQTKLTYVSAATGIDSVNAGATMNVNASGALSGRLGLAIGLPAPQTFPVGTRQIAVITFAVSPSASGTSVIGYGNSPIFPEVADADANTLTATYTPGTFSITPAPSPVPTITSLSPAAATTGGSSFTLTVNGSGFVNTSVVRFNGADRTTTLVNGTQLTAQISAADIQSSGLFPVTVFTPAPGGGTSSSINFAVNNASLISISPAVITAGGPAFTLTANGGGFVSNSVVRFNGSDRPTTFVNNAQLTAQISTSDIQTAGSFPITVSTSTGAGTTNAVSLTVNNPLPTMATLSPASTLAGTAGFTLTVNGTGFSGNSVVRFNGNDRVTTFAGSSQLTAQITAGDIATVGTFNITVFNPAPGGGVSNALAFNVASNPALRVIRIPGTTFQAGQNNTLIVDMDAQGDENALGFSLNFDTAKISYVSAAIGSDAGLATLNINTIGLASGHLGIALSLPTGSAFSPGTRHLVVVTFNAAIGANGSTVIAFGDSPIGREVVDINATILGATFSSGSVSFSNPVPALASISPTSAIASNPGFTLTVNGTNFVSPSVVRFNGSDRPTTFVSSTQLTAQISASDLQATGTLPITVFNPAPGGGTSSAINLTVSPAPLPGLSNMSPTVLIAGGPAVVLTVNGTNFINSSIVRFNGVNRATTFVSGTQLTATILAADIASTGSFPVTVFNPAPGGGTSNGLNVTVNNPVPTLTTLSPANTLAGGPALALTLNGAAFVPTSIVRVKGSDRPTTFVSNSQLTAQLTAADISVAGTAAITVFNPAPGGGSSNAVTFTINTNPAFRVIRVAGATFQAAQNNSVGVELDAQGDENALGFSVDYDPTKMSFVSAVKGNDSSAATLNVNPGLAGSGHVGIALAQPTGVVFAPGTRQLVVMTFSVPIGSSGSTVIGFGDQPIGREIVSGEAQLLGATFMGGSISINNPAPAVSSISPISAVVGGADLVLTVNGTNFVTSSVVRFNGVSRPTTLVSSTQLTAQIGANDIQAVGTFPITVFTPVPGGGTSSAVNFTVTLVPMPSVSSLAPLSVITGSGNFTLTVNGSNFISGSVVKFNGSERNTSFVSGSQLTAEISAADVASAGSFPITVVNPAPGGGISNAIALSVNNPAPTLSSIAPDNTLAGGPALNLTVNGGGFIPSSVVRINGADRVTTFVNSSQLMAQLTATDIGTAGTANITVFTAAPGGGNTAPLSLTINNPQPAILSNTPSTALVGGSAFSLTVNGNNFVSSSIVKCNGSNRVTTFVSSSQLSAQITAADIQSFGTLVITVFSPAPGGGSSNALNVAVENPVPTISSLAPANAIFGSSAFILTVNGSGFVSNSVVRFNNSGRDTHFGSSSQLTAEIAAADIANAGVIPVTVVNPAPGGGISAAFDFAINNPAPTISSLSKSSSLVGDSAFTLTVNGNNFISSSAVQFNGSDRSTTFISSTQLTAQITAADLALAGSFPITVANPAPGGGVSGAINFSVNNPVPTLGSMSPANVLAGSPAFTLTLNGSAFTSSTAVRFNGNNRPTTFVNSSQVTAQLAAADVSVAGSASITAFNPVPGGGTSNALTFSINTNPAFRFVRIVGANLQAGQNNSIYLEFDSQGDENALGFSLAFDTAKMTFVSAVKGNDAADATLNVNSVAASGHIGIALALPAGQRFAAGSRQILVVTFNIPLASSGATSVTFSDTPIGREIVDVNASTLGATFTSAAFTINHPVPTLSNLSPAALTVGGPAFILTVNGSNLVSDSVVRLNGADRPTSFVSSTQLTAQVTAADIQTVGSLPITVFTPGPGGGASSAVNLAIENPLPTLSTLSQSSAIRGDAPFVLAVSGTNFVNSSVVRFNGNNRATTFIDATHLSAQLTAPDLTTAGTFSVVISNPAPGGGSSNALDFIVNNPAPAISSLAPVIAIAGGDPFTLTISGSNFVNESVVKANGTDRVTTFVSSSQLTAQITAADIQAAGSLAITVFSPTPGGGNSGALDLAINNPSPAISNIVPGSTVLGGADLTLTVNGSGFVNGSVVKFNASDRVTHFVSATQLTTDITAADIAAAGVFPITVLNPAPGGGSSNAFNFTVNNPAPTISSLSTSSAIVGDAAFTLTVSGSNFVSGSVVQFNGSNRNTSFISSSQLTAEISAADLAAAGSFTIVVVNPAPGGGASSAVNFIVNNPLPTLSSLSQSGATRGDAPFVVTVSGTNFVNSSVVKFNGNNRVTSFIDATHLSAQLTAADLATTGTFSVVVSNPAPGGGSSNTLDFTVNNPAPVISSLAPASAIAGGGAFTLTINGSNFVNDSVVKFNGSSRSTSFVNNTQISAQITAADIQSAGTAGISVVNPAPGGGSSNTLNFSINNPVPAVTTLSPATAIAGEAGFTLIVNGTNFIDGSTILWNGTSRVTSFVNSSQLTAQITAGDIQSVGTAAVSVQNPAPGGGTSAAATFSILASNTVPTINALTPASATVGSSAFTITVDGSDFVNGAVVRWNGSDRATVFVSSSQLTAQITAADLSSVGTAAVTVFNPAPGGGVSGALTFAINAPQPDPPQLQFSAANFSISEGGGSAVVTVTRSGDTSGTAAVDFTITDPIGFVPCDIASGHVAQNCDYTLSAATLRFAVGETTKSTTIPIIDDAYVEGDELLNIRLTNATGASLGNQSTATLTINDNDSVHPPVVQPIDQTRLFVRQQYLDFLSREPDQGGWDFWTGQITSCPPGDAQCVHDRRVRVADAFFFEPEFQESGAYVYRIYRAGLGLMPTYAQFQPDRAQVLGGVNLDQSKTDFALNFVRRDAFLQTHAAVQTAEQFVDQILAGVLQTSSVDLASIRPSLLALYDNSDTGRARILRQIADNQAFIDAEYNRSFVLNEYFGYLRRDPDQGGFDFWLGQVNRYPLRDTNVQHAMVCSFITSAEYQLRFSTVITSTNQQCPQ